MGSLVVNYVAVTPHGLRCVLMIQVARFPLLPPKKHPVSRVNAVIWIIAYNRLFVLTSPLGRLPSACTCRLPLVSHFYGAGGGFPKALTLMSEIRALG